MIHNIKHLQKLYAQGVNIINYLKQENRENINDVEIIQISYDIQAGSYRKRFYEQPDLKVKYCQKLAETIDQLGSFESILLVGVGEAITLSLVIKYLKNKPSKIYGIDISWSRIKYGQIFAKEQGLENINLFVADLFQLPFLDNSIDLVMSNHSLEPNGGKEKQAICELNRVAKKYVLMNEPSYQFGNKIAQERIDKMGYVKNLAKHSEELGFNVVKQELFGISMNPKNPTENIIIKKDSIGDHVDQPLACPLTGNPLIKLQDCFFSVEGMLAYPIIGGIPCLLSSKSIVATHLQE